MEYSPGSKKLRVKGPEQIDDMGFLRTGKGTRSPYRLYFSDLCVVINLQPLTRLHYVKHRCRPWPFSFSYPWSETMPNA